MTTNKLRSVLLFYKKYLENKKVKNKQASYCEKNPIKSVAHGHVLNMIDRTEELFQNNKKEKLFRWLGFIQGVLWMTGDFTLEQIKNHSRPDNEKTAAS